MFERIFLVGLPASGKTTVGRALAEALRWRFADTDDLCCEAASLPSVEDIFRERGERFFRAVESDVMASLPRRRLVVATGGGCVETERNRLVMSDERSVAVFLDVPLAVLDARLAGRTPAAGPLDALDRRRRALYERARFTVPADAPVPAVCARVLALTGGRGWTLEGLTRVRVGRGVADEAVPLARRLSRDVFVVAEEAVRRALPPSLAAGALFVRGGERVKSLRWVERLLGAFAAAGVDRDATVVAVGGGALLDAVGFAASVYLRGVKHVTVPTTLLAQLDAGVGGKTGVNLGGKNLVGTVWHPVASFADTSFLAMGGRGALDGLGEALKVATAADPPLLDALEAPPSLDALTRVVLRCLRYKTRVVASDPREAGDRTALNCGHTFAHAVERAVPRFSHGRAVAVGVAMACRVARALDLLDDAFVRRVERLASRIARRFPRVTADALLPFVLLDKKRLGGEARFVLPTAPGAVGLFELDPRWALDVALGKLSRRRGRR